jgi:hypothetical protein
MNKLVNLAGSSAIQPDRLSIALRAYVPPPPTKLNAQPPRDARSRKSTPPSEWTLLLDTETTVDASQRLRVGAYQFRKGDELDECGLFYDPAVTSGDDLALLQRFCRERGHVLRTTADFIDEVLFARAYDLRASIVGFNLPFDISRLAIRHGSARGKGMRGGFTFKLSQLWWRPAIQVRHLSARAALIQFTNPPKRRDPRGQRKRKIAPGNRRGSFIDLKTIAAALYSRSFSLGSLADFLQTTTRKAESGGHGMQLTTDYVRYLLDDVQATWECYQNLRDKYGQHALEETLLGKVLSEASLGKAYLKHMGVRPFREVQPDFPAHLTGLIMSTYFGGRAEVRWRREVRQVLYCDFLSMYPTVCTLMRLWRFVIAQGMDWTTSTDRVRSLLETVSLDDLKSPEFWPLLTTLVRVAPQADIFPVRTKYDGQSQTIGLNHLTSSKPLWFTLADVIASKLLTGRVPTIIEAITFSPKEPQSGLRIVRIAGNPDYQVDPANDDFFKRLIDLRTTVKAKHKKATGPTRDALDSEQQALKILANSTSYGIFVEMNVADLDVPEKLICYGPDGAGFSVDSTKVEEPGRFFHPLLATLITGAARLMLGTAERLCVEKGLDWAFCDTDSMAIAKPDGMGQAGFFERAQSICAWFASLNPYEQKGPIFKIEEANYRIAGDSVGSDLKPLCSYCISSKRYVLFNVGPSGEVIIRKASAHGLGQYLAPYEAEDAPRSIPAPSVSLDKIGVDRWHYDLWQTAIRAALGGHSDEVDLSYHSGLSEPVVSRYGATTPKLLGWFKQLNSGREYSEQVKPFNFLIAFQSRQHLTETDGEPWTPKRGRPPKPSPIRPVAPFSRNITEAAETAFDRETDKRVEPASLITYSEALAQYHLRPEAKFLNGDFFDRGRTERRHVIAVQILHIGKEANRWEERYFLGPDDEAEIEYGVGQTADALDAGLREICRQVGEREAARKLEISRTALRRAMKLGAEAMSRAMRGRLAPRVQPTKYEGN